MATNRSGGGPGSIFLFAPKTPLLLNSLSWCSSLLLLLSPVCVPCTCSPVVDVLDTNVLDNNGEGEEASAPPWLECKIGGLEDDDNEDDGGGDERRETSAKEATVASSLNVKLSFTKSDKFLAANRKYMKLQNEVLVGIENLFYCLIFNSNYYAFTLF